MIQKNNYLNYQCSKTESDKLNAMDQVKILELQLTENNNYINYLRNQLEFNERKNNNIKKIEQLKNQIKQLKQSNYFLQKSNKNIENKLKNNTLLFIQELDKFKSENDILKAAYSELQSNQRNNPNVNIILLRQRPMNIFEQIENHFNQIDRNMARVRGEMQRGIVFNNIFINN